MTCPPCLSLATTVVASKQQASCAVASEAVLLSLQNGEYFGLNEVGTTIWNLVQQPRTVMQIRDELLAEYSDVDEETCAVEVLSFLERLLAVGLVEAV